VAADFGLRFYTQRRIGDELAASLRLSRRPSVSIEGFPFLVHAFEGEFPSASADGADLATGGITLNDVRLELRDVRFSLGQLVGGDATTIRARSGDGTATLTAAELTRILRDQGAPVTVRIGAGGLTIESDLIPGSIRAKIRVDGRTIRITAGGIPTPFAIQVPAFVEGLTLTGVQLQDGAAVLAFRLKEPVVRLDQGP